MCDNSEVAELKSVVAIQDDVHEEKDEDARAPSKNGDATKTTEGSSVIQKKRKTRRGKCKRRNAQPYIKNYRKSNKLLKKPEAPYNSNQFLLEDHGNIRLEDLDQKLKTQSRTRDSSFSVDNDSEIEDEFYSSPDDEQEYLIKEFDDQYETEQAERLYAMPKNELIQEYLLLESKVESLTKRLFSNNVNGERTEEKNENHKNEYDLQNEIDRLTVENDLLRQENSELKSKISASCSSDSADSETDSSETCGSSSSSAVSGPEDSTTMDYVHTNGHSPPLPIS